MCIQTDLSIFEGVLHLATESRKLSSFSDWYKGTLQLLSHQWTEDEAPCIQTDYCINGAKSGCDSFTEDIYALTKYLRITHHRKHIPSTKKFWFGDSNFSTHAVRLFQTWL